MMVMDERRRSYPKISSKRCQRGSYKRHISISMTTRSINIIHSRNILVTYLATIILATLILNPSTVQALWFFNSNATTILPPVDQQLQQQQDIVQELAQQQSMEQQSMTSSSSGGGYTGYGSNLLAIAGIRPASIASILNTVGDTGFRYFNIEDQCRNRAACDLGFMLYKKLSFVHNWLIRTSVRSLTDMNNIYTQSWMEGMMGRNCSTVYVSCRQSPLEGIMNLAFVQQLAVNQQQVQQQQQLQQ